MFTYSFLVKYDPNKAASWGAYRQLGMVLTQLLHEGTLEFVSQLNHRKVDGICYASFVVQATWLSISYVKGACMSPWFGMTIEQVFPVGDGGWQYASTIYSNYEEVNLNGYGRNYCR